MTPRQLHAAAGPARGFGLSRPYRSAGAALAEAQHRYHSHDRPGGMHVFYDAEQAAEILVFLPRPFVLVDPYGADCAAPPVSVLARGELMHYSRVRPKPEDPGTPDPRAVGPVTALAVALARFRAYLLGGEPEFEPAVEQAALLYALLPDGWRLRPASPRHGRRLFEENPS